ncbi:hypothetical protein A9R05_07470 [Burkholderia sp. KK1]|nr:hypothetical protein A9R05_07220 [Burkholderia sp. KK1]AQG98693.1 hypothetical protein A9R05_07470 [Burkholderia sp. KK1]
MTAMISGGGVQFTASKNVNAIPGQTLIGIVCSSSTSGTVTIYDSAKTDTTTKLVDTVTLTAGQFLPLYLAASTGHYIVVGGTLSATAIVG